MYLSGGSSSVTPVTVQHVTPDDFTSVTALLTELGRPELKFPREEEVTAVFVRHVASPDSGSLLAERDGRAVGFLSLQFRERLNHSTLEAWIPDLIVTEVEHGTGVATALVERAVAIAKARGCHRLTLESGYSQQRAHRFYVREGFTDAGKFFSMNLVMNPADEPPR
jgi:GNAT superfamily N-acetyltransferase